MPDARPPSAKRESVISHVRLYIVYTLLVGLADATNKEEEPTIRTLISQAQVMTVFCWLTYPGVYLLGPRLSRGAGGCGDPVRLRRLCSRLKLRSGLDHL